MKGLLVLLGFFGLGTLANRWLHVPMPGNLLGMLLLTVCLCLGWVKLETVERTGSFLLKHMMLFFVPIMVGVAQYLDVLKQDPWPVFVSLLAGPLCVMAVSGVVVQRCLDRGKSAAESQNTSMKGRALDA
jgi:holin-like protein